MRFTFGIFKKQNTQNYLLFFIIPFNSTFNYHLYTIAYVVFVYHKGTNFHFCCTRTYTFPWFLENIFNSEILQHKSTSVWNNEQLSKPWGIQNECWGESCLFWHLQIRKQYKLFAMFVFSPTAAPQKVAAVIWSISWSSGNHTAQFCTKLTAILILSQNRLIGGQYYSNYDFHPTVQTSNRSCNNTTQDSRSPSCPCPLILTTWGMRSSNRRKQ